MACWIKPESIDQDKRLFFCNNASDYEYNGFYFNLPLDSNHVGGGFGSGGGTNFGNRRSAYSTYRTLEIDTWHHIAMVIEGPTNMHIYIDCEEVLVTHDGSGDQVVTYNDALGTIGKGWKTTLAPSGKYFQGSIDEFGMWNRALTADDVASLCGGALSTLDPKNEAPISIFPNPSSTEVQIQWNEDSAPVATIEIFDLHGRKIYAASSFSQNNLKLSVENLPSGRYFVKLVDEMGNPMYSSFQKH